MAKVKKSPEQPRVRTLQVEGKRRLVHLKQSIPYFVMLLIPLAYFVIFCYWPMFGITMAFQDYKIGAPFMGGSEWVGLKWFKQLLNSPLFPRLLKNTLVISLTDLAIGFPLCIVFALLLNEVRVKWLRRFTANVSMLPWFISTVVVVAILHNFFSVDDGIFQNIIEKLGGERTTIIGNPDSFVALYVGSGIWQGCGYGAAQNAALIGLIFWLIYKKTKLGMILRAGVDNFEIVAACGINIKRLFTAVFSVSGALAGIAGVFGGTYQMLVSGQDGTVMIYTLLVVIIGGIGSFGGAIIGSILIGLIYTIGTMLAPQFSYFFLFAPVALAMPVDGFSGVPQPFQ